MASDQCLHCLLTGFPIKNRMLSQNRPDTPKMKNGLFQPIAVEESTSIQWVKMRGAFAVPCPHFNIAIPPQSSRYEGVFDNNLR